MRYGAVALLTVALSPTLAMAEVSDNAPTIPELWTVGVILGGLSMLAGWYRWWLGLIFLALTLFLVLATYDVIADPHVGPAIRQEQGELYVFSSWASMCLLFGLNVLGIVLGRLRLARGKAERGRA